MPTAVQPVFGIVAETQGRRPGGGVGPPCLPADPRRPCYHWDFFDPKWSKKNDFSGGKKWSKNGPKTYEGAPKNPPPPNRNNGQKRAHSSRWYSGRNPVSAPPGGSGRRADPPTLADPAISGTFLTQNGQKINFSGVKKWPKNDPKMAENGPKMAKKVTGVPKTR